MAFFNPISRIHLNKKAQIASLLIKKVKIANKYLDFTNLFLEKKALVLSEYIKLNEHAIDLKNSKQPPYRPIHSLDLIELDILKIYIKIYLKTGIIWYFKPLASALILFDNKPDSNFRFCVDY